MEITTRQDAIRDRKRFYFTGKACKHGHISKRYTQSAACESCVHPKFESVEINNSKQLRAQKLVTISQMKRCRFRIKDGDIDIFLAWALGVSMLRESSITLEDILRSQMKPERIRSDCSIRALMIFPEDEEEGRKLECMLEGSTYTKEKLTFPGYPAECFQ